MIIKRIIRISLNDSMNYIGYHNRENSINIQFETNNNKIKNIKNNNNADKSVMINVKDNKKIKNKKIRGKTNLIMTVINDNLLGNLNYNDYINNHLLNLYNKSMKNGERLKK